MKKIAIVTTSRADWSGLGYLAKTMEADLAFEVKVLIVGQHLDDLAGANRIMAEFPDSHYCGRPPYLKGTAIPQAAWVTRGIGEALDATKPDLMVLLGDRYETLAAALAATILRVPIAHLDGGDRTTGSFDDAIRHAVTKLAHLHFPTTLEAADRIVRMGERPERVHIAGSTHVDALLASPVMTVAETREAIGPDWPERYFVVNWQPETLAAKPNAGLDTILHALCGEGGPGVLFVGQNADPGAEEATRKIMAHIRFFDKDERRLRYVRNLPADVYRSALAHCCGLIGNSSSAYYEAPYLRCWAVDVGDRQGGRGHFDNVLHVAADFPGLARVMGDMVSFGPGSAPVQSPYGDGTAALKISKVLREHPDYKRLLVK